MQKSLILLAFVSYEAVRLWWWGGNYVVVSFGKTPCSRSIPTRASKLFRWLFIRRAAIADGENTPYHLPGIKRIIKAVIIAQGAT